MMPKSSDPSDINNSVNGFNITKCSVTEEITLFLVFPNLSYGIMANTYAKSNDSTKDVKGNKEASRTVVNPTSNYTYDINDIPIVDKGAGLTTTIIGTETFYIGAGIGKEFFLTSMPINSICAKAIVTDPALSIPIPLKIDPLVENEEVEAIRTADNSVSLQWALLSMAMQVVQSNPGTDIKGKTGDAIVTEIMRLASSMSSYDGFKWTGNSADDNRVEFSHLGYPLDSTSEQSEEAGQDTLRTLFQTGMSTPLLKDVFSKPSVIILHSGPSGPRLYHSSTLSDAIMPTFTIIGRDTPPKIEFSSVIKLLDVDDISAIPNWSENMEAAEAAAKGISSEEFAILSNSDNSVEHIFPSSLIVPIENGGSTFRQYNEGTGLPEDRDYTLITPRPPVFTAGEYMITADNSPFIPITNSYFYPIVKHKPYTYENCRVCGGTKSLGFETCLTCIENPGYVKNDQGDYIICPNCIGTGIGKFIVCPVCNSEKKSYVYKCGTCGHDLGEQILLKTPDDNNPRYELKTENGENILYVYLNKIIKTTDIIIYMNNTYVPNIAQLYDDAFVEIYTINGNVIKFNYMITGYPGYNAGNLPDTINSIEVYESGPAMQTCEECKIEVSDVNYRLGYVFSPTVPVTSSPDVTEYITELSDVLNLSYRYPDNNTTPAKEGFNLLGSALYMYNEIIVKARPSLKYIAGHVIDKWNTIDKESVENIVSSTIVLPISGTEVSSWEETSKKPWLPWRGAAWESNDSFWDDYNPENHIMLLSNLEYIGQSIPSELSIFEMPQATGLAEEQSKDYLDNMISNCIPSGYATVINKDNIHKVSTIREVTYITNNNSSGKSVATDGISLDKEEKIVADTISPIQQSIPLSVETGGTIKVGDFLNGLISIQNKDSILAIQQLLHTLPEIARGISNMVKQTSIIVKNNKVVPTPVWEESASPIITTSFMCITEMMDEITTNFDIGGSDKEYGVIENSLKAIINDEKPVESIVESIDVILDFVNDVIFYSKLCRDITMYRNNDNNGTVFHSYIDNDISHEIEIVDSSMIYGTWFYNIRKTYLLWISAFSLLEAMAIQIYSIACSFKYTFSALPVVDAESGDIPTRKLDIALFIAGDDKCHPIVESSIELTDTLKNATLGICQIADIFGSNTLHYDIEGKVPTLVDSVAETIPLVGMGAADNSEFDDQHEQFFVTTGELAKEPYSTIMPVFDTNFDYLRNSISTKDFMIRESGELRYISNDGNSINSITMTEGDYPKIFNSITNGGKVTINRIESEDFTGKINCSMVLPYLSNIRQTLSPSSPIDVDFKSGQPDTVDITWTYNNLVSSLDSIMTNKTNAMLSMDKVSAEIKGILSNKTVLDLLYNNPGTIKFNIPFLGFADASISTTNNMCESALMAYVFHALGFTLRPEFLSGGIVNKQTVAQSIGNLLWYNGTFSNPEWALNYNLFLSKRRAYIVALYIIYKLSEIPWQVGEYEVSISTTPGSGPDYATKVFNCYGFGAMFGSAAYTADGRANNIVKGQRTTYISKMIPTLGILPVTGISNMSIHLTAPIGRDITGDIGCMSIIENNTIYSPVTKDKEYNTFVSYNKDNNDIIGLYNNAAEALLVGGENAITNTGKNISDMVLLYANGKYPASKRVRLSIGEFISGAFNQLSPVYLANNISPFKTTTSILDDFYLNIHKI